MTNFKSLTREERKEALKVLGQPAFREKQIFEWICRGAESFDEMTNLSKELRAKLSESYSFESLAPALVQNSADGTKKFLLSLTDGNFVEAVFMKYEYGNSLCISTQVGCNMGCRFCASTIGGKTRDLKAWEMLDEFIVCQKNAGEINHLVLMGIGEPFDNYDNLSEFLNTLHDPAGIGLSWRNITVSSCGLVPMIERFSEDFPQVNLAISLHASSQAEREEIMPVAKRWNINELLDACKKYTEETGRRISFEYTLIKDKNDTAAHAERLAKLLSGMLCHVNLIPLNPVTETGLDGSSRQAAYAFAAQLESLGIQTTVRRSLGQDIDAACGQLRNKNNKE